MSHMIKNVYINMNMHKAHLVIHDSGQNFMIKVNCGVVGFNFSFLYEVAENVLF